MSAKIFDKNDIMLYIIAGIVILFVLGQSIFFLVKALKRGKELGISKSSIRSVITSSAVFTLPSALSVLATVIALSKALGFVIPWVRLSVIGNLTYETVAAEKAMTALGHIGGMAIPVEDPATYTGIIWVMTFGIIMPLILCPFLAKPILKKINNTDKKADVKEDKPAPEKAKKKKIDFSGLMDYASPAVFIGLIGAFVARAIAGKGKPDIFGDGAGILSLITLATSLIVSAVLEMICKKFKLTKLEPFVMPIGMMAAMAVAIISYNLLPEGIRETEWRG